MTARGTMSEQDFGMAKKPHQLESYLTSIIRDESSLGDKVIDPSMRSTVATKGKMACEGQVEAGHKSHYRIKSKHVPSSNTSSTIENILNG